ncbi:HNH endonuclease signature motif containing protein [Roseovarius sp. THAF9]|uniref:HNH endonuclease n=1 Tax=Roseovarius sp. THAF9 TaxID=2587847 RepID=UPI0015627182|nr:HNH endonuclease signature motif containing protein [Roseovarius sp. THAF9]
MRTQNKPAGWAVPKTLAALFTEDDGFINFSSGIQFDENQLNWPFYVSGATSSSPSPSSGSSSTGSGSATGATSPAKTTTASTSTGGRSFIVRTEDEIASDLFDADYSEVPPDKKEVVAKVRVRNQKAVRALKKLYGECQISGEQYVFPKEDGDPYLEVHHLIPLGLGGADSPANLVVLSAHMHRMLHYANVGEIDLSKISGDQLTIRINGNEYTIRWRPDHAAMIKALE